MGSMAVDPDFARAIIQNIGLRWSKEELCDLKITVGEKLFACSQFHLCACSEFFDVLLHPGHSTTKTTDFHEIRISGISPDIFALVLNAIFKGENKINAENIIELWYATNHLQIIFLIQKCEAFIVDELTVDNYLNVYPHALILKSEVVLDKILGIFTSNFEQLRHTQTFLDMSAETLFKLIERKDFKSYDSVIDFIIEWVEKDDGKKEESTYNMMDSTSVKNIDESLHQCLKDEGDKFVEVIFRNEMLHPQVVTTSVKRKDLLGTLMTHTQLNQVSNKSLKVLLKNDLVMDNREARNAVVKALDTVLEVEKQVVGCSDRTIKTSEKNPVYPTNSSGKDDNLVPVVLFLKNKKLMAYTLLSNKFFYINIDLHFKDILVRKNQLFVFSTYYEEKKKKCAFCIISQDQSVHLIYEGIEQPQMKTFFYNDSFLYYLTKSYVEIELHRMKCTQKILSGLWTDVGHFKSEISVDNLFFVVNFKKYILLFVHNIIDGKNEIYHVIYFDPSNRKFNSKIAVLGRTNCHFKERGSYTLVNFRYNERLFVLHGNGNLTEILEKDGDLECQSHPPLWNFFISLYGAAVFDKTLYILADLETQKALPKECLFGSMQFVQFLKDAGPCHFAHVCKDWLNAEL